MKWLKLTLLLLLTLMVMRLCSWGLQWLLTKLLPNQRKVAVLVANGACLTAFIGWLWYDLLPGEPIDFAAVIFGVVVFGTFALWDARRTTRTAMPIDREA